MSKSMWKGICQTTGCHREIKHPVKELCSSCYRQQQRPQEPHRGICKIDQCGRPVKYIGLCYGHYAQQYRGQPFRPLRDAIEERLFIKRKMTGDGCWQWTGGMSSGGYGVIGYDSKRWNVHRLAYTLWVGAIPNGEVIHHTCHNRLCFNPTHLQCITKAANTAEMMERQALMTRIVELETQLEALR